MTKQRGRKPEAELRRHVVSTKVDDPTLQGLELVARVTGKKKADVVRDALEAYLRPTEVSKAA